MNDVIFQQPALAWLLLLAPLALVAAWLLRRRRFAAVASQRLLPAGVRASRVRALPAGLAVVAFAAGVLALMDPVLPLARDRVVSRGIDIVLVLDLSSSMEEVMGDASSPSARETRLDVTKRALTRFIGGRPEDRVGLVVFSDNAYVVSPLTLDHEYLRSYVAAIDEQTLRSEGMTAIGEGLAVADSLLRRQSGDARARNSVVVVFTDGEHNHGRDPVDALATAADAGHRVHLIGVDLDDEVKHKPAVQRLVRAVEQRGGRYFTADSDRELTAASRAIDRIETGQLVGTRTVQNVPVFDSFAAVSLLALCGYLIVRAFPPFVDLT